LNPRVKPPFLPDSSPEPSGSPGPEAPPGGLPGGLPNRKTPGFGVPRKNPRVLGGYLGRGVSDVSPGLRRRLRASQRPFWRVPRRGSSLEGVRSPVYDFTRGSGGGERPWRGSYPPRCSPPPRIGFCNDFESAGRAL
jgi:hypothetical protein